MKKILLTLTLLVIIAIALTAASCSKDETNDCFSVNILFKKRDTYLLGKIISGPSAQSISVGDTIILSRTDIPQFETLDTGDVIDLHLSNPQKVSYVERDYKDNITEEIPCLKCDVSLCE